MLPEKDMLDLTLVFCDLYLSHAPDKNTGQALNSNFLVQTKKGANNSTFIYFSIIKSN